MKMESLNYCENWLGGRDSNPDKQIQSLRSYRWTTSQSFFHVSKRPSRDVQESDIRYPNEHRLQQFPPAGLRFNKPSDSLPGSRL